MFLGGSEETSRDIIDGRSMMTRPRQIKNHFKNCKTESRKSTWLAHTQVQKKEQQKMYWLGTEENRFGRPKQSPEDDDGLDLCWMVMNAEWRVVPQKHPARPN
jgi:hypothetical protein